MKLSIAAAIVTMSTTVNARLHPDDDSKKNRKLQWGPKNMVERSLVSPAISALRDDVISLEAEDNTLNGRINETDTAIATANTEITELQDDVVRLDAEDDTLNGRINETDTAIATAETAISALQDDVVRLDAEDDTLNGRIDAADSNITALASRLVEEDDTLHGLIDTANTNIDTANANITALASRLEAAEATINELTSLVRALTQTPTQSPSASPTAAPVTLSPTDAPVTLTGRKVFITSESYTGGAIGGIAGANLKCQDLAIEAELSGTFKAWLSDSTGSPDQDFVQSDVPYLNTNGDKVADDWLDLTDSNLDNAIAFDENGVSTPSSSVWTGTDVTGMPRTQPGGTFCNDWTSTSGSALIGRASSTDPRWTVIGIDPCGEALRLYCFEQ